MNIRQIYPSHTSFSSGRKIRKPRQRSPFRRLVPDAGRALAAICVWVLLSCLAQFTQAAVEEGPGAGVLMFIGQDGQLVPAPLMKTSIDIDVNGAVARVRLEQQFFNRNSGFVEGRLMFPLPDNAAVRSMRIEIGGRVIVGSIAEKQAARETFVRARNEGKVAGLVEQQRPNLFTTEVTNIPPAEAVTVKLEYIQQLDLSDASTVSLRLPTTLTPRFTPPSSIISLQQGPSVAEADIEPEALPTVSLEARLKGSHLRNIRSSTHKLAISDDAGGERTVSLDGGAAPMDRDIVVQWTVAAENGPYVDMHGEQLDDAWYGLLVLAPQSVATLQAQPAVVSGRDVIFVLDTSGSMSGESIRQAKGGLSQGLKRLTNADRFNVIEFNSDFQTLFTDVREASTQNINSALQFVDRLDAEGGTEMLPALRAALASKKDADDATSHEDSEGRLRQVIFITDGAVSNESELFGVIHSLLGESRLFSVGIGSAPNSWFMRKAAELGRGSASLIGNAGEVDSTMTALFRKLESPVLRSVEFETDDDMQAELYPAVIPDLYAGEPVVVAIRAKRPGQIRLKGMLADSEWSESVMLESTHSVKDIKEDTGISVVWARARIEDIERGRRIGKSEEEIEREVTEVALRHRLASAYTSFIAVEQKQTRPQSQPLDSAQVPNLLPAGYENPESKAMEVMSSPAYVVQYPQTAAGQNLLYLIGLVGLVLAALMRFGGVWRRLRATVSAEGAAS